jgi:integrating conjugative element protein (TIGR03757 family)
MIRSAITAALLLVSLNGFASTLTAHIFKSDDASVQLDQRVPPGMEITVYHLDAMQKADALLGRRLNEETRKPEYRGMTPLNASTKAFSKVLNSNEWEAFNRLYMESSEPIEKAIRYRIKKLPAIVFDNEFIVYGVSSFREALAIYKKRAR